MARKKIDDGTRQKVLEAYKGGLAMRKIANECKVSLSSVHRIVKEQGLQKTQGVPAKKMSKAERLKRIAELEKRIAQLENRIREIEAKKR